MGKQVIQQPDGLFAIFSSNSDTIHMYDATAEEIEEYFVERAEEEARRAVERARVEAREVLGHLAAGEPQKAYYQFAMTWDEALESDREHDGEVWQIKAAPAVS